MNLEKNVQEAIAEQVIKILVSRFKSFPDDSVRNRNAPFHEAFLSAFKDKLGSFSPNTSTLISMSSWLHGLNTSLGQAFFENIASSICGGCKREWTSKREGNLEVYQSQKEIITDIISNLSNSTCLPDLDIETQLLQKHRKGERVKASDFSADVFIEDQKSVTGIEMKSVKPNAGEMKGEKNKNP